MEKKVKMSKPKTSHGILVALEKGRYNRNLFDNNTDTLDEKAKIHDYKYSITTADNVLTFITLSKTGLKRYSMPLAKFDWRLLWDKLGDVPVNDDGELEEPFEHFGEGTDREDVWRWFEWFFNISIGKELFE